VTIAASTLSITGTYTAIPTTGAVSVTIAPTAAVTAGAQWRLDGGSWQAGGATVTNVSAGNHTVSFSAVTGWTTPASQVVSVNAGATTTTSGTYVVIPPTGAVKVTLVPAGAVSAGAQWALDGGVWRANGASVSGVSVGQHSVSFKTVSGWNTPSNQLVTISNGATTSITGTYVAVPTGGALTVTVSPSEAAAVGGKWRVDGGDWQADGATVTELSAGTHTVSFKPVAGWSAPSDQTVTITIGLTANATGTYALVSPSGALQVSLAPAGAVGDGAHWRVDDGTWQSTGATVTGLAVGEHIVEFESISGWNAPASQTVEVAEGATSTASGAYSLFADVNGDFAVDASDIQLVINAALGASSSGPSSDLNADGDIDAVDIQLVINAALGVVL